MFIVLMQLPPRISRVMSISLASLFYGWEKTGQRNKIFGWGKIICLINVTTPHILLFPKSNMVGEECNK